MYFPQGKLSNIIPSAIHAEDIDASVNNSVTYAMFSSGRSGPVFTNHSQEHSLSFFFLQDLVNLNVTQLLIG